MNDTVVLDARPVSQVVHPRKFGAIKQWFQDVLAAGWRVVLPEIVDYEVRRGLLRIPAPRQFEGLDVLVDDSLYLPLTTEVMRSAAHVWAEARRSGQPFTANDRLDADAILIAQTRMLGDPRNLTVITENIQHLKPFVPATRWQNFEV